MVWFMKSAPLRLLVVDESRSDRASFRRMLRSSSLSHVVHETSSPWTLMRSSARIKPHCIFFEVLVNGTIATGLLDTWRRSLRGKRIPVIVWTALSLPPLVQAAIQQMGTSGWLFKYGSSREDLERTIRSALQAR